jgi:DNA-binding SARP family transcriptional activator
MNQHSVLRRGEHAAVPAIPTGTAEKFQLRLLGGFDLRVGDQIVTLPLNVRRLMALLAVRELPQTRASIAYTLWMDTSQSRASANLRSTLWKLGPQRERLLHSDAERLWLSDELGVDFIRVVAQAKRLIGPGPDLEPGDADVDELANDLLPDWDEDWLQDERERLRQLRVHALEALCTRLRTGGRDAEAVCAGQAAVAAEPLRESAQRLLITAHLAEGNVSEARRQFEIYRHLLWENLHLSPSPQIARLLAAGRTRVMSDR